MSLYLVCEGDSLTVGFSTTINYPLYLAELYIDNRMVSIQNWATSGDTVAGMLNASETAPIDACYDVRKGSNILAFWGGTNDLSSGTADGPTTYSNYVTYCSARKAAGFKVIAFTIMDRADTHAAGFSAGRTYFNGQIAANWQSYASALVDVNSDSRLTDPTNTTYFQPDKIHLTAAGYQIVAAMVKAAMDPLL